MKKAFLQLHIAVFLAGFTAILGKLITLNEILLVWYRLLLTVLSLLLILLLNKEFEKLSLKNMLKTFSVGALVALHWVCFYGSIKYSNVSVALTCLSAIGFFTAFFEPLIMRRRVDIFEIFLGLLAIAGIYLIFNFYPQYKTGIIFGIISAMLASIFPVFNKTLLAKFSSKTVTFYEMCGGCIALTIIMPFYLHQFPAKYYFPTISDWLWLLILAWLCTVLSFILQLNALKKLSPFTSNLTYNLEPVYGIILAFIFFNEHKYLGRGFYFGLGLILFAVILLMMREYSKMKSRRQEEALPLL
jgi:drug/metabolite transporter (DMT)-like permease